MLTHARDTHAHLTRIPTLEKRRLRGTLTGSGLRYGVNLEWDGTRLTGRLGGVLLGENVQLERVGDALLGTVSSGPVSSSPVRLAVHARFTPDEHDANTGRLELRLCGLGYINTAAVTIHADCVTGTVHAGDEALEASFALNPARLEGRVADGAGNTVQHVQIERAGVPNFALVTAALMVDAVSREVSRLVLESLDHLREI